MDLNKYIRDIDNFPIEGVTFKDITPLLDNPESFKYTIEQMAKNLKNIDKIVGLDARGFLLAGALAYKLNKPLVLIRKTGKLPHKTITEKYKLEYGENSFDIHKDSISVGEKVAIIDDLLATGGTVRAAINLVEKLGGVVSSLEFIVELGFLGGKKKIGDYTKNSLLVY